MFEREETATEPLVGAGADPDTISRLSRPPGAAAPVAQIGTYAPWKSGPFSGYQPGMRRSTIRRKPVELGDKQWAAGFVDPVRYALLGTNDSEDLNALAPATMSTSNLTSEEARLKRWKRWLVSLLVSADNFLFLKRFAGVSWHPCCGCFYSSSGDDHCPDTTCSFQENGFRSFKHDRQLELHNVDYRLIASAG
jgi:hypothetical protein